MGTYICGEGNMEGKGGELHGGAASIGEAKWTHVPVDRRKTWFLACV